MIRDSKWGLIHTNMNLIQMTIDDVLEGMENRVHEVDEKMNRKK